MGSPFAGPKRVGRDPPAVTGDAEKEEKKKLFSIYRSRKVKHLFLLQKGGRLRNDVGLGRFQNREIGGGESITR